MLDTHYFYF